MDIELEKYKEKVSYYSIEELEEILISLNKDKFPEKYDLVKNCLAEKIQNKLNVPIRQIKENNIIPEKIESSKVETLEKKQEKPIIDFTDHEVVNVSSNTTKTLLIIIMVFTSIFATYVLLLATYNLPGKQFIIKACKQIPCMNFTRSLKQEKIS